MGRRVEVLGQRAGEDVTAFKGAFCVAVLARLRGANFEDLAGVTGSPGNGDVGMIFWPRVGDLKILNREGRLKYVAFDRHMS